MYGIKYVGFNFKYYSISSQYLQSYNIINLLFLILLEIFHLKKIEIWLEQDQEGDQEPLADGPH